MGTLARVLKSRKRRPVDGRTPEQGEAVTTDCGACERKADAEAAPRQAKRAKFRPTRWNRCAARVGRQSIRVEGGGDDESGRSDDEGSPVGCGSWAYRALVDSLGVRGVEARGRSDDADADTGGPRLVAEGTKSGNDEVREPS